MPKTLFKTSLASTPQADPTLVTLKRFDQAERWHVVRNVPVFKAHVRRRANGAVAYRVTEPELAVVARKAAKLEARGSLCRITTGHIKARLPEHMQPKPIGYARSFRVGRFGPRQEQAVLCDFWLYREHASEASKYPFRSVEYYPLSREIRGLALLVRDPYLDLGTLTYSRGKPVFYALERKMDDLTPEEKALFEKFMKAMKSQDDPEADIEADLSDDDMEDLDDTDDSEDEPEGQDKMNYQKADEPLKKIINDQGKALLAMQQKVVRAECKRLISDLAQTYSLDADAEIEELSRMDDKARAKHVERIKRSYAKLPGELVETYSGSVSGVGGSPDVDKVLNYMRNHNMTDYFAAQAAVKAGKK